MISCKDFFTETPFIRSFQEIIFLEYKSYVY